MQEAINLIRDETQFLQDTDISNCTIPYIGQLFKCEKTVIFTETVLGNPSESKDLRTVWVLVVLIIETIIKERGIENISDYLIKTMADSITSIIPLKEEESSLNQTMQQEVY